MAYCENYDVEQFALLELSIFAHCIKESNCHISSSPKHGFFFPHSISLFKPDKFK